MVAQTLILLLVLILPLSALMSRRLPWRTVAVYAGAWIAIFVIGWIMVRSFT
ncbi:MAG: hypothetical protein PGN23_11175 [Sphingomonas adhaesiva]|uniref:hypothetical protein n=1 Tax=Sphingomonas adhaesiva TaxID=28212 RepID=UPI002FF8A127